MFKKGNILRDSAIFLDEHMTGNLNVLVQVTSNEGEGSLKNPKNLDDIEKLQNFLDSMDALTSEADVKKAYENMDLREKGKECR